MRETTRQQQPTRIDSDLNPSSYSWAPDVDLLCFSHLRWDFVFQRPQHLLTRAAQRHRVFYFEEPIFDADESRLSIEPRGTNLTIVVPHLPAGLSEEEVEATQRELLRTFMRGMAIEQFVLWLYTPMAIGFCCELEPVATVYDCMDELTLFKGASPQLKLRELDLINRADVVFTGGQSLFEVKRQRHPHVHAFPSSIDVHHFGKARRGLPDPADQAGISHPRIGFFGVLDERLDVELLRAAAALRPEWSFVLLGPVVKIDPAELPRAENIHYLGAKKYDELPGYIAHWDVATLLFARNEATRFISPTKTPEYLAAGKPVVSTSIRDVVRPYGRMGLVEIADEPDAFVAAIDKVMHGADPEWLVRVDEFLSTQSWDQTWNDMTEILSSVIARREPLSEMQQINP